MEGGWSTGKRKNSRKIVRVKATKLDLYLISLRGEPIKVKTPSLWEISEGFYPFF